MSDLRAALDRLTDDEQQAAYVHSRRVWYPTPPTPKETR